jgi:hypothetical protein
VGIGFIDFQGLWEGGKQHHRFPGFPQTAFPLPASINSNAQAAIFALASVGRLCRLSVVATC